MNDLQNTREAYKVVSDEILKNCNASIKEYIEYETKELPHRLENCTTPEQKLKVQKESADYIYNVQKTKIICNTVIVASALFLAGTAVVCDRKKK